MFYLTPMCQDKAYAGCQGFEGELVE